jgi:tetratricopeptide (TPR) repeat protein
VVFDSFGLRVLQRMRSRRMPSGTYNILVADLVGDGDGKDAGKQTNHILRSLETQFGAADRTSSVRVQCAFATVRLGSRTHIACEMAEAHRRAQRLIVAKNADILIWGETAKADQSIRLHFTPRAGAGSAAYRGYELTQVLELPKSFGTDLGGVLATLVAADRDTGYVPGGSFIHHRLRPILGRLAPLVENPPAILTADQRATFVSTYALAASGLADESRDIALLEKSIAAWRDASALMRDVNWKRWATFQCNLASALTQLAIYEHNEHRYDDAMTVLWSALEDYPQEGVPICRVMLRMSLASVLVARYPKDERRLNEAIGLLRGALSDLNEDDPSSIKVSLLNELGERLLTRARAQLGGSDDAGEAVQKHLEALSLLNPKDNHQRRAETCVKLGDALFLLGKRDSEVATPEMALGAYFKALEEYGSERSPFSIYNRIAFVLSELGEREKEGTRWLEIAEDGCRAALSKVRREDGPLAWAAAVNNLAITLGKLGERTKNREKLIEAGKAARGALKVFQELDRADEVEALTVAMTEIDKILETLPPDPPPRHWWASRNDRR